MERIIFGPVEGLPALAGGRRVVALCDRRVAELYDLPFEKILVDASEVSKTFATVEQIVLQMVALGADRETFLLGVGGGVVCDIAGFVAAIYMRGIAYGLVPTTLLAQADAAIGGKNGVNVGGYKNLAGTFGEPEFVLCDAAFLQTLPPRELRSGLAEVAKAAIIGDAELFEMLEGGDYSLDEIVRRAVAVKLDIVSRDRHETAGRRLLNLGHTVGHAIEKVSRSLTHGEAVAVGIVAAARVAVRLAAESVSEAERQGDTENLAVCLKNQAATRAAATRIENLLKSLGLPVATDIDPAALLAAMRADKKNYSGTIRFVLPAAIGSCIVRNLPPEDIY
jgi:3-dehydroquinate synthase